MRKLNSIIIIILLLGLTACSEDSPTENEKPVTQYKVSGRVTDIDKNPIEGIKLVLTLSTPSDDVELGTTTDASGYYEILNNVEEHTSWSLKAISTEFEFTPSEPAYSFAKMDTNLVINFEKNEDYVGKWIADSSGLPASAFANAKSSIIDFVDNHTMFWFEYDSNGNPMSRLSSYNLMLTKSSSGDIHAISTTGRDSSGTLVYDYRGIYRVDKIQPNWILTFEILNVLEGGNTAPSVESGFGSANNGADGMDYVWTFKKE